MLLHCRAPWFTSLAQQVHNKLTHLDLSHNNMGHAGVASLGGFVMSSRTLKSLNVSWNKLCNAVRAFLLYGS